MSVEEQIRAYLGENVLFSDGSFGYNDDDSFLAEGIIDSVAVMELVFYVEERFEVGIEDREIVPENFDSVNKLARFIRAKQAHAEPSP